MEEKKDLNPESISEEEASTLVKILNENLRILISSANHKTLDILNQTYEKMLPFKKSILKDLTNTSTKEKPRKFNMLKKFLKIAFTAQTVNHFISKEESITALQENLQLFFEVDNFALHLLVIYCIGENFERFLEFAHS